MAKKVKPKVKNIKIKIKGSFLDVINVIVKGSTNNPPK